MIIPIWKKVWKIFILYTHGNRQKEKNKCIQIKNFQWRWYLPKMTYYPLPFSMLCHDPDGVWERPCGGGHGGCCSSEPAAYERRSTGGYAAQHGLSHHRPARRRPRRLRRRRQLRGTSAVQAKLSKLSAILQNGRRKQSTLAAPVWILISPLYLTETLSECHVTSLHYASPSPLLRQDWWRPLLRRGIHGGWRQHPSRPPLPPFKAPTTTSALSLHPAMAGAGAPLRRAPLRRAPSMSLPSFSRRRRSSALIPPQAYVGGEAYGRATYF